MARTLITLSLLGFLTLPLATYAQNQTTWLVMPQLNYRLRLDDRWQANVGIFSEFIYGQQTTGQTINWEFRPLHLNLQAFVAYQLDPAFNLALGYQGAQRQLNQMPADREHRLMQQLTWSTSWGKYRWQLRSRTEQRFFRQQNDQVVHRWRLRTAFDFPLNGERLDPGESFCNLQAEGLVNPFQQDGWQRREWRFYLGWGRMLAGGQRWETGPEWRTRIRNAASDRSRAFYWRLSLSLP